MKFTIIDAPQGSDDWKTARAGRVTGSRAADITDKIKSGESAKRRDYRVQLVCERLTGTPQEQGFISKEMEWGIDQEPFARAAYEAKTGLFVRQTGFLSVDDLQVGCSLDGDADNFKIIQEFKCPKTATHLKYLLAGVMPSDYIPQVTHNMLVSGAERCDFVSYDPRLPEHLQLFIVQVYRDKVDIDGYSKDMFQFLREVEALETQLRKMAA